MHNQQKRKLDASDIATILVALRMFQRDYQDAPAHVIARDWPEHFTTLGDDARTEPEPLSTDDIDRLCEELNCGKVTL